MDLVEGVWGVPFAVPYGLVIRLAALLPPDEVVWADAAMRAVDVGKVAGSACLMTAELVVMAVVGEKSGDATPLSVEVWSRSRLRSVEFPSDAAPQAWDDIPTVGWPVGAKVLLSYDGRNEPLRLPLSDMAARDRRQKFADLMPSLVADLRA